jgi:hypothetical protein
MVALNLFREAYGKPMRVTSGYRPGKYNTNAGGAKNSSHISCEACDFADPDGELAKFCLENIALLEECKLYLESPKATRGWIHLQVRHVVNRVFNP